MIRNWLRNFMIGRYGPDQLYMALLVAALVLEIISRIFWFWWMRPLTLLVLGFAMFRMFSRNIYKRRQENDRFLRYWWPVKMWFKRHLQKMKDRKFYAFFKCPACKNNLRVPKGKGKIQITCPKCGERFIKKT